MVEIHKRRFLLLSNRCRGPLLRYLLVPDVQVPFRRHTFVAHMLLAMGDLFDAITLCIVLDSITEEQPYSTFQLQRPDYPRIRICLVVVNDLVQM